MSESDYLIAKAFRMPKIAMPGAKKKAAQKAQDEAGMKAFHAMGTPKKAPGYVSKPPPVLTPAQLEKATFARMASDDARNASIKARRSKMGMPNQPGF